MKIALVNLCSIEDIAKWKTYSEDINFLKNNNIDYIDYASGRSTKEELFSGFLEAVNDKDVSVVWFACGGTTLVQYLHLFDWDKIRESKKVFVGSSDFTHFSIIANSYSIPCFYGLTLKRISKFYSHDEQEEISNFLKEISTTSITDSSNDIDTNNQQEKIQKLPRTFSDNKSAITGGCLLPILFLLRDYNISFANKSLFIEHHYAEGESYDDLEYMIRQLCISLNNNIPLSLILGHSMFYNKEGGEIEYSEVNKFISKITTEYFPELEISEVDHFKKCITMR